MSCSCPPCNRQNLCGEIPTRLSHSGGILVLLEVPFPQRSPSSQARHGWERQTATTASARAPASIPRRPASFLSSYTFRLPSPCFLLCCSSHPSSLPVSSQKAPLLSSSIPHLAILFNLLQELLVIPFVMQGWHFCLPCWPVFYPITGCHWPAFVFLL